MNDYQSKQVYFSINQKSYLVAYILLFFLFCVGAHRFYTKNTTSAITILLSTISIFVLSFIGTCILSSTTLSASYPFIIIGTIITIILIIWFLVDIFLTYKNVKIYNTKLAIKIGLLKEDNEFLIKQDTK